MKIKELIVEFATLALKTLSVILTAGSLMPSFRRELKEHIGKIPAIIVILSFSSLTLLSLIGQSPKDVFNYFVNFIDDNSVIVTSLSEEDEMDIGKTISISGDFLMKAWTVRLSHWASGRMELSFDGAHVCTMEFSPDKANFIGQKFESLWKKSEDGHFSRSLDCQSYPHSLKGKHDISAKGFYAFGDKVYKFDVKKKFNTDKMLDEFMYSPLFIMNDKGKFSISFGFG